MEYHARPLLQSLQTRTAAEPILLVAAVVYAPSQSTPAFGEIAAHSETQNCTWLVSRRFSVASRPGWGNFPLSDRTVNNIVSFKNVFKIHLFRRFTD